MNKRSKYSQYSYRLLELLAVLGVVLALIQICHAQSEPMQDKASAENKPQSIQQFFTAKECKYE